MKTAAQIADKYIAPDGSEPKPGVIYIPTIVHTLQKQGKTKALAAVSYFLASCPPNVMYGGYSSDEAFKAFCEILDVPDELYKEVLT